MIIYHNPMWGKSRKTLQILQDEGVEFSVVEYIKKPLNRNQIKNLLSKLKINAQELIRKNNSEYKNASIDFSNSEKCIALLEENPKLLQRPIIEDDENAVIGRPPENVYKLLK